MNRDYHKERLEKLSKEEKKKEPEENPLKAYSTSQLKAELRRRKKEY